MVTRDDILREAGDVISGARQETYGDAAQSHERIAQMWSAYLGVNVTACDVAAMMVLMKVSRSKGKPHKDNWVDICGYAALAGEMESE